MCNFACSVVTAVVGCILVVASCLVSFLLVPNVVENTIIDETVLLDDTIQYERFEKVPFPLQFKVMIMQISNPEEVLAGGVPRMNETGPYVYNLFNTRNITYAEGDIMRYHRLEEFEFDGDASLPLKEDDMVTIINVPYHLPELVFPDNYKLGICKVRVNRFLLASALHRSPHRRLTSDELVDKREPILIKKAIIQMAQERFPNLMIALNLAMSGVFGVHNSPIATFKVRDLLFTGVRICESPGIVGTTVCGLISQIGASAKNLVAQEDGSLLFSLLEAKNNVSSPEYEIYRGLQDSDQLGHIRMFDGMPHFSFWVNETDVEPGVCNMINGTDSGIFAPFVDKEKSLYAINTDICRSVELRYQYDVEVDGIPTMRFSANEWFIDNHQGCFCLNTTEGITQPNGCLLAGAMELYSCVGAKLVMSYPHFLYADMAYRNGVIGMEPNEENHRIFIDIEPNTGTPIRAAKRAQFNIFQRPISGISATTNLHTTLVPIVWFEESVDLPEEFKDELASRLLSTLNIISIVIPVLIAACCAVLLVGLVCVWRSKRNTAQPMIDTNTKM